MKPFESPIYVTRPFLPPIDRFSKGLEEIWDNAWLTNDGPLLRRFETELLNYLNAQNICLFSNGTLALQIALQGMGITGEVITTPFTFVATMEAVLLAGAVPVFSEVDRTLCLDPGRIADVMGPRTKAVIPVHMCGSMAHIDNIRDPVSYTHLRAHET